MPEGISHEGAAARARACGILVVMDRCMKKELERLRRAGRLSPEPSPSSHREAS